MKNLNLENFLGKRSRIQRRRRQIRHRVLRRAMPTRREVYRRLGQHERLEASSEGLQQYHWSGPLRSLLRRDGHLGGEQHGHGLHAPPMQHRRARPVRLRRHRLWRQRQWRAIRWAM